MIWPNGDIYEGGFNMDYNHGKGEWEHYENGIKEIGHWVNACKQGEFEYHDKNGALTHRKIYEDDTEIKSEEIKQQI